MSTTPNLPTQTITNIIYYGGLDTGTLYRALQDYTTILIGYVNDGSNRVISTLKPLLDFTNASVANVAARFGMFETKFDAAMLGLFGELGTIRSFASLIPAFDQRVNAGLLQLAGALQGFGLSLVGLRDGVQGLYPFIGGFLDTQNRLLTTFPKDLATSLFDIFMPNLPAILDKIAEAFKEKFPSFFEVVHKVILDAFKPFYEPVIGSADLIARSPLSFAGGSVHSLMSQLRDNATSLFSDIQRMLTLSNILEVVSVGQIDRVGELALRQAELTGVTRLIQDGFTLEYEHGIKPQIIREINETYQIAMPTPTDLVTMVVREAFEPAFITPAPDVFRQYMRKLGFSDFWSDKYWTAHWRWLPNETAIEMFHRGIIDEATLARTFIINDVHPQTLPYWLKFVYRLPNRVEARIMGRLGLLTPEQMDTILKAEGISPEFIPPLRAMIFEYHLGSIFTAIERFAISAFEDGYISEGIFNQLMTEARFPQSIINAAAKLASLKRHTQIVETKRKLILDLAKRGGLDFDSAQAMLAGLGIAPDVIAADIEVVKAYKTIGTESDVERFKEKLLTSALDAYDDGILSEAELSNIMAETGIAPRVAQAFARLASMRKFWMLRRSVIKSILTMYRRGVIDYATARGELLRAGLDETLATIHLETIRIELEAKKPKEIDVPGDKLTVAQILKALKEGVISFDAAATFLAAKGYDAVEIQVLLQTAAVEMYRAIAR
jgi:hypothetical protein